jgi:hypothetical protein
MAGCRRRSPSWHVHAHRCSRRARHSVALVSTVMACSQPCRCRRRRRCGEPDDEPQRHHCCQQKRNEDSRTNLQPRCCSRRWRTRHGGSQLIRAVNSRMIRASYGGDRRLRPYLLPVFIRVSHAFSWTQFDYIESRCHCIWLLIDGRYVILIGFQTIGVKRSPG